ncbi:murein hydrolase activator NlpD [Avibacterium sp. 21-595]|uniref:murein hydrolase activator NlpD n=1 Tax=unclassified Avibacterium TaxID=2685287 RepID=UPI00202603D4|nr:murein hydrolase activator NlpD [Avibacterium sp. 21-595]URL01725.1 murein hydrolase activator NlpD [Avibacterium sp. 20-126]URL06369.1 murein hydrolase activator NlpD [Avibacterium sp. 21-595]
MKKSFLLLPITMAVLSACSSTSPAPVENADGALPPGTMQPVDSNAGSTWEPQIQQQSMPATMTAPVTPQPTYQAPQVQAPQIPQPVNQTVQQSKKAVANTTAKAKQVSQNFEIPRNPETNAPDYSKIDKGFYKGNTYTVRKGDTMFLIAYICGLDVKELAAMNNMSEPYTLSVGQTLKVSNETAPVATNTAPSTAKPVEKPAQPAVTYTPGPNGTQYGSDGSIIGPIKSSVGTPSSTPIVSAPVKTQPVVQPVSSTPIASNVAWQWPTNGKIVQGFSSADGGNKGIDISGSRGQAVNAAAAGRVVYAGNALRGYGNLIIIKHNDDYLSAYAHNESLLVKDQQEVKAGQQIAKMGNSGTNSVKLHFEIRYKGKSVDPIRYLPRR